MLNGCAPYNPSYTCSLAPDACRGQALGACEARPQYLEVQRVIGLLSTASITMQLRGCMARDGPPTESNSNPTFEVADRLQWGAYQAAPVEPVDIPKAEGRQRPIGKPTLEDTIVLALPPRPALPARRCSPSE